MNSFDIPMPSPTTEMTPAARRAARKRSAAERARNHRERLKQEGLPTSREVDQALAEALSFVSRRVVVIDGRPLIDIGDVVTVAALILKRSGKRKNGSLAAVRDRIAHRPEHTGPTWMPSTRPKPPNLLLPPEGGGRWTETDVQEITAAMDRTIIKRTPSQP